MKQIAILATLDTKGDEAGFLKSLIEARHHHAILVDTGVQGEPRPPADISREEVAQAGGTDLAKLREQGDRGEAVASMAHGAAEIILRLYRDRQIDGVIGIGGSAGTTIGTTAMRALPTGVPKLMVSTLASGDTRPYVGTRDITMMYSVVDVSGLNGLMMRILSNAAGAICGMVEQPVLESSGSKPLVAATMFGVTTPCVTRAREILEARGYEVLVFHATGTGGRAMEELINDGFITGVLDITTTEWADELVGGVLSAGPNRLEAGARAGIPQVVSVGALDMVNFGPVETIPERFRSRKFHIHNPTVTLMRTTPDENRELGKIIAEKLNMATGLTVLVLPLQGVSAIDRAGQPFDDPQARQALFAALRENLDPRIRVIEIDANINDPIMAETMANTLATMIEETEGPTTTEG